MGAMNSSNHSWSEVLLIPPAATSPGRVFLAGGLFLGRSVTSPPPFWLWRLWAEICCWCCKFPCDSSLLSCCFSESPLLTFTTLITRHLHVSFIFWIYFVLYPGLPGSEYLTPFSVWGVLIYYFFKQLSCGQLCY